MSSASHGRWGKPLECGPFAMEHYAHSLRWLRAGDIEWIRMIGIVIRDRAWRTMLPAPGSVALRRSSRGASLEGSTPIGAGRVDWQLHVKPRDEGLDVEAIMQPVGHVLTNRTGLVVLLPTSVHAGAKFVVAHRAGGTSRGTLPTTIAPHQPMLDVAELRIALRRGPALHLAFGGDTFEMEDQRNWLDPTFKLYSRALARPVPYRLREGAEVRHTLRISLSGRIEPVRARAPAVRAGKVPRLGVALPEARPVAGAATLARLQAMQPAFVHFRARGAGKGIARARNVAQALGADLHLECFGDRLTLVAAATEAQPATLALHGIAPAAREAMLRTIRPGAAMAGTFSDFVMVNRNRDFGHATRVAFSLCPTVHGRDDRTLVESLGSLDEVFAQARRLAGKRAVDAGPAALLRRLQPRTGRPATRPLRTDGTPFDVDARQGKAIAAAWLACAIAIAARQRLASFCAFEATGARGLLGVPEPFPLPEGLAPGEATPAFAVMAALCARRGQPLVVHAMDPSEGAAFSVGADAPELWLIDLAGHARTLPSPLRERVIETIPHPQRRAHKGADDRRWSLEPYGIVRCSIRGLSPTRIVALAAAWCHPPE